METDADDSREFRVLCAIAMRCWDADPTQGVADWGELVKVVLGKQRRRYDPDQLNRALSAVLHQIDARPRPASPVIDPPVPTDWDAVGSTLRAVGLLPAPAPPAVASTTCRCGHPQADHHDPVTGGAITAYCRRVPCGCAAYADRVPAPPSWTAIIPGERHNDLT